MPTFGVSSDKTQQMTVVYQYTQEEHKKVELALVLMAFYEQQIEDGALFIRGIQVESIYHLIHLLPKK